MKIPNTHGGKREGAGRKVSEDPKVKIWFSVKASKEAIAREMISKIIAKLNK